MPTTHFDVSGFRGDLIHPDSSGYDDARSVFNGMIDRRPALIARCTSTEDVAAVVNVARTENLPLSVYGGGHGVTGAAVVETKHGDACLRQRVRDQGEGLDRRNAGQ